MSNRPSTVYNESDNDNDDEHLRIIKHQNAVGEFQKQRLKKRKTDLKNFEDSQLDLNDDQSEHTGEVEIENKSHFSKFQPKINLTNIEVIFQKFDSRKKIQNLNQRKKNYQNMIIQMKET